MIRTRRPSSDRAGDQRRAYHSMNVLRLARSSVSDRYDGLVAAQAGDDQMADGAGVTDRGEEGRQAGEHQPHPVRVRARRLRLPPSPSRLVVPGPAQ